MTCPFVGIEPRSGKPYDPYPTVHIRSSPTSFPSLPFLRQPVIACRVLKATLEQTCRGKNAGKITRHELAIP